jgi:Glyoxalase/Bleomycin resistance protein/Dioxygenase superfamily
VPGRQTRAVAEFLGALDDEDADADSNVPKVISPVDPCSAWTAKANKRVQFGYGPTRRPTSISTRHFIQRSDQMLQDDPGSPTAQTAGPIHPETRIGHVHLKVSDLERSLRFYCGVLGFDMTQRFDSRTAFVSTGGYHHLIGLNTRDSLGHGALSYCHSLPHPLGTC